jgi:hypothetical protein
MAGKADKLKKNVRRTSNGLFGGMEKLDTKEKAEEQKAAEQEQRDETTVKQVEKEEVPETKPIKDEINVSENDTKALEKETPVAPKAKAKEVEPIMESPELNVPEPAMDEEIQEAVKPTVDEYIPEVVAEPVVEAIKEAGIEYGSQSVESPIKDQQPVYAENTYASQQSAVINPQPQAYVQQPVYNQVAMQQPIQQPQYNQIPLQQTPIQQYQTINSANMYAQQMQPNMPQQAVYMPQNVQQEYAEPKTTRRGSNKSQEKTSRYEKDKFLLLDIRGLRDYVEHMAKASNMSATKYIRNLIEQDMGKNMDIYLRHKELEEQLKNRR